MELLSYDPKRDKTRKQNDQLLGAENAFEVSGLSASAKITAPTLLKGQDLEPHVSFRETPADRPRRFDTSRVFSTLRIRCRSMIREEYVVQIAAAHSPLVASWSDQIGTISTVPPLLRLSLWRKQFTWASKYWDRLMLTPLTKEPGPTPEVDYLGPMKRVKLRQRKHGTRKWQI